MRLIFGIAVRHLLMRKRQSIVSLLGIVLGVGFFLAIASLMQGSEKDFIRRLVDNSPHITVYDEYRLPHPQPVFDKFQGAVVNLRGLKPQNEPRGIRSFEAVLKDLNAQRGTKASPVLAGQVLISFAGQNVGVTLNGMIPDDIIRVTTIEKYMVEGRIDDLSVNPNGIIIGRALAHRLSLVRGRNVTMAASNGQVRTFKIIGIFSTGRSGYDERQAFVNLKRAQALLDRPNRINNIIVKLDDPYQARHVAENLERRIGYKSVSWQETSEDLMSTIAIRNTIMYTVVSAVLIVAAFGIYNVISTIVMEKQRDIAILKSMGFHAADIKRIFSVQGLILGLFGIGLGLPLGMGLMVSLAQIHFKPPGSLEVINMPVDWGWRQFAIAAAFAMLASFLAALLPARKAAVVQPVDILRGGT